MFNITKEWLRSQNIYSVDIIKFAEKNQLIGLPAVEFIKRLIEFNELYFANRLITKLLDQRELVRYAVFAAESVLPIWVKRYPHDDRPRKAIDMANEWLNVSGEKPDSVKYAAIAVSDTAAEAVEHSNAYVSAARAAQAAEFTADVIVATAYATDKNDNVHTSYYTYYVAHAAYCAARYDYDDSSVDAGNKMLRDILTFGIELIESREPCKEKP